MYMDSAGGGETSGSVFSNFTGRTQETDIQCGVEGGGGTANFFLLQLWHLESLPTSPR